MAYLTWCFYPCWYNDIGTGSILFKKCFDDDYCHRFYHCPYLCLF